MKYFLFKGLWDKWKNVGIKENVNDMLEYFKELERFLSGVFKNRISLRDNLYCEIIEQSNVMPNINIRLNNILKSPTLEGVIVLQTSEPGDLVWSQASPTDFVYRFESTSPSIAFLKLVIFYR